VERNREPHVFHTLIDETRGTEKTVNVMGRCVRGKSMIHGVKVVGRRLTDVYRVYQTCYFNCKIDTD